MVKNIYNYYQYSDTLAAGGQPTPEQLEALKKEGFQVVFSISPASTRNYLQTEAAIAESLGMEFVHYPVDCSNLKDSHYKVFSKILEGIADKKVFVHCGGNIKSSSLIHMYKVLEMGVNEEDSLQELKTIHKPEQKWFEYFKKQGMQGLS